MRPCTRCGEPTAGSWSEGGHRWALCETCMAADRAYRDTIRRQRGDDEAARIERDDWLRHLDSIAIAQDKEARNG